MNTNYFAITTEQAIRNDVENVKIAFVYDDGSIRGFTYMDKLGEDSSYKKVHFYIFIHPVSGRRGLQRNSRNK